MNLGQADKAVAVRNECLTTDHVTALELPNPSLNVFEIHKIDWSPDHEALKLGMGKSGWNCV